MQLQEEHEDLIQDYNASKKAVSKNGTNIKKRTYKPRMTKQRQLELLQKQRSLQQAQQLIVKLCRIPSGQYKYFIRGGLLIDFDFLREQVSYRQSFFSLNDFKPTMNVQYNKSHDFYEIHFDQGQDQIQNFNFVIEMMNSVGDQSLHELANALNNYAQTLHMLDKQREESPQTSILNGDILLEEEKEIWSYDNSFLKANKILKEKLKDQRYFFYILTKGHKDYSEIGIYGINNNSLKMILGNLDHDSTVKILLQNGLVLMNQNFMDVLQTKLQEALSNLNESYDPEYLEFQQKMEHITINNHRLQINFTYEKYRLSDYSDRFNDTLLLARIDDKERQNVMNQLFIQKLLSDTSVCDEKVLLSDITYQAQSEYFMEKFYSKNDEYYDSQDNTDPEHDS